MFIYTGFKVNRHTLQLISKIAHDAMDVSADRPEINQLRKSIYEKIHGIKPKNIENKTYVNWSNPPLSEVSLDMGMFGEVSGLFEETVKAREPPLGAESTIQPLNLKDLDDNDLRLFSQMLDEPTPTTSFSLGDLGEPSKSIPILPFSNAQENTSLPECTHTAEEATQNEQQFIREALNEIRSSPPLLSSSLDTSHAPSKPILDFQPVDSTFRVEDLEVTKDMIQHLETEFKQSLSHLFSSSGIQFKDYASEIHPIEEKKNMNATDSKLHVNDNVDNSRTEEKKNFDFDSIVMAENQLQFNDSMVEFKSIDENNNVASIASIKPAIEPDFNDSVLESQPIEDKTANILIDPVPSSQISKEQISPERKEMGDSATQTNEIQQQLAPITQQLFSSHTKSSNVANHSPLNTNPKPNYASASTNTQRYTGSSPELTQFKMVNVDDAEDIDSSYQSINLPMPLTKKSPSRKASVRSSKISVPGVIEEESSDRQGHLMVPALHNDANAPSISKSDLLRKRASISLSAAKLSNSLMEIPKVKLLSSKTMKAIDRLLTNLVFMKDWDGEPVFYGTLLVGQPLHPILQDVFKLDASLFVEYCIVIPGIDGVTDAW